MFRQLLPSALLTVFLTLILGLLYPLGMTGVAERLFPAQAHGSLIDRNGTTIGSTLIGQNFARAEYFHPRPSATTVPDPADATKTVAAPYNAGSSAASNAALSSKTYQDGLAQLIEQVRAENPQASGPVPVDLVTASGSGLDPDISPEAAIYQAARVAQARHATEAEVTALIDSLAQPRWLGIFGAPHVNVLALNIALDDHWPMKP